MKKCLAILYLIVVLLSSHTSFSVVFVEGRKSSEKSHSKHHHKQKDNGKGNNSSHRYPSSEAPSPSPSHSNTFSLLSFGAKGDGATDDTKALSKAWDAACKIEGATVEIPTGYRFLIKPLTLEGHDCKPQLQLQIDGSILAPPNVSSWPKLDIMQWINIKWVKNFIVLGNGVIDGQGSQWWGTPKKDRKSSNNKPTALRFYGSKNVTVRDIKIVNSPQCHLKFDDSLGVKVEHVSIFSPGDSPNTDGVHLQDTQDVEIHHSNISSGDDCVSIQTGCSNVHVHHLTCGPGHGISVGALGKGKSVAYVSDIVIDNIVMHKTVFGARIKTWPGGSGLVKNVSFSNIQVSDVGTPLEINMYYCENNVHCKNYTGGVAISNIHYNRIHGTFSTRPVNLACCDDVPCVDVDLVDIQLNPSTKNNIQWSPTFCKNSYGKTENPLSPSSIHHCLRDPSRDTKVGIQKSREQSRKQP